MHEIDKVLEELKTPEGKEKRNKILQKYMIEQRNKDEKIRAMISNSEYIEWLRTFIQDKGGFTDEDWRHCPDKISNVDRENVDNLHLLYSGIREYASYNHIEPGFFDFGEFYKVKYNDFCFKIGVSYGKDSKVFCNMIAGKNMSGFINFNNILLHKRTEVFDLDKLYSMVINMYDRGIAIEPFLNSINGTIRNINYDSNKTLKKKK